MQNSAGLNAVKRDWLLVAGCWLLVAGYWLLVAGYWLLILLINIDPH